MLGIPRKLVNRRAASQACCDLGVVIGDLRILHGTHPETMALLERAEENVSRINAGIESWRNADQGVQ